MINTKLSFVAINKKLLEFDMSASARLIAIWVFSKKNGCSFDIDDMKSALHITDKAWASAKKELIEKGFFKQTREKNDRGQLGWINEFDDSPLYE